LGVVIQTTHFLFYFQNQLQIFDSLIWLSCPIEKCIHSTLLLVIYTEVVVGGGDSFAGDVVGKHITQVFLVEVPVLLEIFYTFLSFFEHLKGRLSLTHLELSHCFLVNFAYQVYSLVTNKGNFEFYMDNFLLRSSQLAGLGRLDFIV
jgi:hypothetical protein